MRSELAACTEKYPSEYPEFAAMQAKITELAAEWAAALAELDALLAAKDARALRAALGAWKYPKAYPEYGQYMEKLAATEAELEGILQRLEGTARRSMPSLLAIKIISLRFSVGLPFRQLVFSFGALSASRIDTFVKLDHSGLGRLVMTTIESRW